MSSVFIVRFRPTRGHGQWQHNSLYGPGLDCFVFTFFQAKLCKRMAVAGPTLFLLLCNLPWTESWLK